MPRPAYLLSFILLASAVVPLPFFYGWSGFIVPLSFRGLTFVSGGADWVFGLLTLAYTIFYLGVFYGLARLTLWFSEAYFLNALRRTVQLIFLMLICSCSFLRVITYGGFEGGGGTYNFFGAVQRYFEKYSK